MVHEPGAGYELRIRGSLDPRWRDWFDGFEIVDVENGATRLRGRVVDQAALHGVLAKIRDLNLEIISVVRL
jgi:hypothetical protein